MPESSDNHPMFYRNHPTIPTPSSMDDSSDNRPAIPAIHPTQAANLPIIYRIFCEICRCGRRNVGHESSDNRQMTRHNHPMVRISTRSGRHESIDNPSIRCQNLSMGTLRARLNRSAIDRPGHFKTVPNLPMGQFPND